MSALTYLATKAALADMAARASLMAFIPHASPGHSRPEHLRPYIDILERAAVAPVRGGVSTPPRHGKTESTLHCIVWRLKRNPRARIAYATYAAEFSHRQNRKAALIAKRCGIQLAEDRLDFWRTPEGGEVIWTSIGGPLTGHGVDLLVVDDPVKDRAEAESPTYRERASDWFSDVALTRLEPGASAVVIQTRWHPDDLAGRLIKRGWSWLTLPAIDDRGRALWPQRYPVEALREIQRENLYTWHSLYQGNPQPRGGSVFRDVRFYDDPPRDDYRVAIGVDFAYTAKSHADYSAAVVLAEKSGAFYVLEAIRQQTDAPAFASTLAALRERYPGARMAAYVGGTERGVVQFFNREGLRVEALTARGDKFTRAQSVAAAWNAGKVAVPRNAAWVDPFINEVCGFTGIDDPHDDQVDALVGAFSRYAAPERKRTEFSDSEFAFG